MQEPMLTFLNLWSLMQIPQINSWIRPSAYLLITISLYRSGFPILMFSDCFWLQSPKFLVSMFENYGMSGRHQVEGEVTLDMLPSDTQQQSVSLFPFSPFQEHLEVVEGLWSPVLIQRWLLSRDCGHLDYSATPHNLFPINSFKACIKKYQFKRI